MPRRPPSLYELATAAMDHAFHAGRASSALARNVDDPEAIKHKNHTARVYRKARQALVAALDVAQSTRMGQEERDALGDNG